MAKSKEKGNGWVKLIIVVSVLALIYLGVKMIPDEPKVDDNQPTEVVGDDNSNDNTSELPGDDNGSSENNGNDSSSGENSGSGSELVDTPPTSQV